MPAITTKLGGKEAETGDLTREFARHHVMLSQPWWVSGSTCKVA